MLRIQVKLIRKDLEAMLKEYGKKNGLQFTVGRITFDSNSLRTKLTCIEAKSKKDAEELEFKKNLMRFKYKVNCDLEPEDYGVEFNVRGEKYILIGIAPKSRQYPLLAKHPATGRTFKFTLQVIGKIKNRSAGSIFS